MGITRILNIKKAERLPESEQRRIRLVLLSIIMGILSTVLYIFLYLLIDRIEFMPVIFGLCFFILLYSLSALFLFRGIFRFSKYTLMLSTSGSIVLSSIFFLGKGPGIHIYFLLFALMPIVIFSFRERIIILGFFLLNLACFLLVEIFLPEDYPLLHFPEKYEASFHIMANVITFTLIAVIVILYQWLTEENEKELHRQSEQLKELNATKDRFFSIIAHDLRNPFNAILNSSRLLMTKFTSQSDDKKLKLVAAIHASSEALHALLENLLLWAQLQSQKICIYPEDQNLPELIEESISLYQKSLKQKDLTLDKNYHNVLHIQTDRYIVSLVIRNLISNAIKFTPPGGKIAISIGDSLPGHVLVSIKDTGIGIMEEDIPFLFQTDISVKRPGTNREEGSGLGLVLCRESLEKIGGYIEVKSRLGEGSEFIVHLRRN